MCLPPPFAAERDQTLDVGKYFFLFVFVNIRHEGAARWGRLAGAEAGSEGNGIKGGRFIVQTAGLTLRCLDS